jgi:hypothetical protein
MERVNILKQAIIEVYEEYAAYLRGSNFSTIEYQIVADDIHLHYLLLAVGWEKQKRIFYVIFQADIKGNAIWIQEDNTEEGLATFLKEKGISNKEIVLAYFPEYHRKYTEYAVA